VPPADPWQLVRPAETDSRDSDVNEHIRRADNREVLVGRDPGIECKCI
jgi:hypothetical protein